MPFNLAGFVFCVCLWYVLLSAEDMTRIPGTNYVLSTWRTLGDNLLCTGIIFATLVLESRKATFGAVVVLRNNTNASTARLF